MAQQQRAKARTGARRKKARGVRMAPNLASKFDQFQKDSAKRTQTHAQNRGYQQKQIGKFERDKLEDQFKGKEYEIQLNEVSNITKDQINAATTYEQFQKEQNKVSKLNNVGQYEEDALKYKTQSEAQEPARMDKEEQIKSLLHTQITLIIGQSGWDKSQIEVWMNAILNATGGLLDQYLTDGVYKYCINVNILKSTAIALQSDVLKSNEDFSFNLKIKNGCGVIVVLNCSAFRMDQ
eukprot:277497_1